MRYSQDMIHQNTVHQGSLRSINVRLALSSILSSKAPPNRAQVAASIGSARSTAGTLVDELIAWGLVDEIPTPERKKRGRPGKLLVPSVGKIAAIGVEINVVLLAVKVIDMAGNVLSQRFVRDDLRSLSPEKVAKLSMKLISECRDELDSQVRIAGTALAVSGMVDSKSEMVLVAPNLGWATVDFVSLMREAGLSGSILIFNEADCAALSVSQTSPGKPSELQDFLYVSAEVGIGAAFVVGGSVRTGKRGWAGEMGHICVDSEGERCACGAVGCLEVYAGQRSMCAAAKVESIEELSSGLKEGNQLCKKTVLKAASALGIAISAAMNLLDVSTVVLGGHLGRLAAYLIEPTLKELNSRVLWSKFSELIMVPAYSNVGSRATGAAFAVLDRVIKDPSSVALKTRPSSEEYED